MRVRVCMRTQQDICVRVTRKDDNGEFFNSAPPRYRRETTVLRVLAVHVLAHDKKC